MLIRLNILMLEVLKALRAWANFIPVCVGAHRERSGGLETASGSLGPNIAVLCSLQWGNASVQGKIAPRRRTLVFATSFKENSAYLLFHLKQQTAPRDRNLPKMGLGTCEKTQQIMHLDWCFIFVILRLPRIRSSRPESVANRNKWVS